MEKDKYVFNRVLGLKFLNDNFPYYFNKNRIQLYFADSKEELLSLQINDNDFDTLLLKRSANPKKLCINDLKFKDNRFFNNLLQLKEGAKEFDDIFNFCVECHKFKKGETYWSDYLAIAQFSTEPVGNSHDSINFIPARVPGVNTRDNNPYLIIDFPYDSGNIYSIVKGDCDLLYKRFSNYDISYLATKIHDMIDNIRDYLIELNVFNTFQLIIRIDSYLNLLPIDFRTFEAWAKIK